VACSLASCLFNIALYSYAYAVAPSPSGGLHKVAVATDAFDKWMRDLQATALNLSANSLHAHFLIILLVVCVHYHLYRAVQVIFMRGDVNRVAAVAAVFDIILIIATDI